MIMNIIIGLLSMQSFNVLDMLYLSDSILEIKAFWNETNNVKKSVIMIAPIKPIYRYIII